MAMAVVACIWGLWLLVLEQAWLSGSSWDVDKEVPHQDMEMDRDHRVVVVVQALMVVTSRLMGRLVRMEDDSLLVRPRHPVMEDSLLLVHHQHLAMEDNLHLVHRPLLDMVDRLRQFPCPVLFR